MIAGLGIDMIEIERVAEKIARSAGFKEKVFSANEITYCEALAHSAQHYAARFAAKEAFLKATGKGLAAGYELSEIEVVPDANGKPEIVLVGNFKEQARIHHWNKIFLSISHVKQMACAVVIIEQ
jgi:holo-[acyl-carrier protein] synthase